MRSKNLFYACSSLGLALAGSERCIAQVCPNLDYGHAAQQVVDGPWCAAAGDVDGDGADDLFVGRSPLFTAGGVSLLLNAGNGQFPSVIELPQVSSARSLALGDIDLDGDLDLVVSDRGLLVLGSNEFLNDGIRVFTNDGQGHFTPLSLNELDVRDQEPEGLRLGDLDGDGDLDVAVAIRYHQTGPLTSEGSVLVYLNDGQGALTNQGAFPAGTKPDGLVLVDFNGDQALDFATVNENASLSVVLGHGDGTFDTTFASYSAGLYPGGLASGDFDGDGDVDLAVGSKYGVRMLLNQGNGAFASGLSQLFGYYNKALVAGDFNQDGKVDLLATFASAATIKFLAGAGDGSFAAYKAYPAGSQSYALATGDWNGDGILDAASADYNGSAVDIWSSVCAPSIYCTAKPNSQSCVPLIGFAGIASASAGSGFVVSATNVLNQKTGLLLYGTSGRASIPFGGGILCLASPLRRTPAQSSGGAAFGDDCSGQYAFDFNAWIATGTDPALAAGSVVDAQYWSRDPGFTAPDNVGLTDALEFTIAP